MKYYGIVEGFFSKPLKTWTMKERELTLHYISQNAQAINTYFYCPKDDPMVTSKWNRLYSKEQLQVLKKLINRCKQQNIKFVYGLNPTLTDNKSWLELEPQILAKLEQVLSIGCSRICLLFDDIPEAYDVLANKLDTSTTYDDNVALVNTICAKLTKKLDDFWLCAADYCFKEESELVRSLRALNKTIKIIWSGKDVFTKEPKYSDLKRIQKLLPGYEFIYWSNYPVNDCEQAVGIFNLGGFYPIAKNVRQKLAGILVNPMRECYANLPFYRSFSEAKENINYDRDSYWDYLEDDFKISPSGVNLIKCLASRNFVDKDVYKDIPNLKNLLVIQGQINNYGSLYLKSIKQVLKDSTTLKEIISRSESSKRISINLISKFTWFPTKTNVPRYFYEVYNIVRARYLMYSTEQKFNTRFEGEINKVDFYKNKYLGKKALKMQKQDRDYLQTLIDDLIKKEQKQYVSYLNNDVTTAKEKLASLLKRRGINRFNL